MICPNPNCGYEGKAKSIPRGSVIGGLILLALYLIPGAFYFLFVNVSVGLVLLFFGSLPGVFYFVFKSGWRYECPKCKLQIGVDN